jgi:hypothetical protein
MIGLVDTLLNIMVFVFIGLLIWLYVKKEPEDSGRADSGKLQGEEKG